ncbi:hypothetical protein DICSQDRAFT_169794 [Dichomitus squalens LYAD-421 SS1]|uniref:Protein kinase domain-containing protein n=1 Tax=Dichomitus squalens (strain LYAD-421) TaxID=732165 RepID=R7T2N8_DICSQ|nr:uncharacterized protein DICSQDRAFT_169794 [Dichomitus squalens LYAD-421 SS1]EJF61782.1 hypothetical protein DICSQDRAFT_169794 [Dichomitus squalens LYAD-421 SS1]
MDNLRQTVEEFDQWSDDTLEELARLGKGVCGAVYKVRDRRMNVVMARKAITTLEALTKELLREDVHFPRDSSEPPSQYSMSTLNLLLLGLVYAPQKYTMLACFGEARKSWR